MPTVVRVSDEQGNTILHDMYVGGEWHGSRRTMKQCEAYLDHIGEPMSYVSKDELYDAIEENIRSVEQGVGKQLSHIEKVVEAMELRVERHFHTKEKVVALPAPSNAVKPKEFAQAQDDIDELFDLVRSQARLIKALMNSVTEMYEEQQAAQLEAA